MNTINAGCIIDRKRELLLRIIEVGLIGIKEAADDKNYTLCYIEAEHIHNIPQYIAKSPLNLDYYFKAEVVGYLESVKAIPEWDCSFCSVALPPVWKELKELIRSGK